MNPVKQRLFILSLASTLLTIAAVGVVWSVVPFEGETLPRLLERAAGVPFHAAALLTSVLSAAFAVGGLSALAFFPVPELARARRNPR